MGKYYTRPVFLYILKFGLTMEFAEVPVPYFVPSWNFSPAKTEIIDVEIFKLLSNGVIVNTPDHVFITFWRTKKKGDYRMILSLETLDGFLKLKHCKLESCILYHPYSSKSPKIPEIFLEGRILSIHCPYQWIFISSKSLYKCFDSPI